MPETIVEEEWLSAQQFARIIRCDPDDVRKRIKAGLHAGGHMMAPLTGTRPLYKVHYPTFMASMASNQPGTEV